MKEEWDDKTCDDEACDDWEFRDLFERIRDIDAPAGLHRKCIAVAREATPRVPATKRFPEPIHTHKLRSSVAIAASLIIGLSIGWTLRGQTANEIDNSTAEMAPIQRTRSLPNYVPIGEPFDATSTVVYHQEDTARPLFVTRELYLCGVGRVQSTSEFQFLGEKQ